MDFWTNMALAVLFGVLKEKAQLVKLRPAMIKLYRSISAAYADDETFRHSTDDLRS